MVTIKHNRPTSLDLHYIGGKRGFIQLLPGVNINVDDTEWQAARKHPAVKYALETGILDELFVAPSTADLDGIQVSLKDDALSGQGLPVSEAKYDNKPAPQQPKQSKWVPTESELIALSGVGKVAAKKILSNMPESGFNSINEFKTLNEGINFDESEVEAKFS